MHPPQQTTKTLRTADSKRATPINDKFGTVESQKALLKSSHLNPIHSKTAIIIYFTYCIQAVQLAPY